MGRISFIPQGSPSGYSRVAFRTGAYHPAAGPVEVDGWELHPKSKSDVYHEAEHLKTSSNLERFREPVPDYCELITSRSELYLVFFLQTAEIPIISSHMCPYNKHKTRDTPEAIHHNPRWPFVREVEVGDE